MSELIAIVYPDEERARTIMSTLRDLEGAHLLHLEDACYVTKDERGRVELHQSINLTAHGAAGGAFWGTLLGLIFLNPLVGLATGAAAGAIAGVFRDVGISDDFMKSLGRDMAPGTSAIFALIRDATFDKVEPELARFGGRLLHTSMNAQREAHLRDLLGEGSPSTLSPSLARAIATVSPRGDAEVVSVGNGVRSQSVAPGVVRVRHGDGLLRGASARAPTWAWRGHRHRDAVQAGADAARLGRRLGRGDLDKLIAIAVAPRRDSNRRPRPPNGGDERDRRGGRHILI